MLTVDPEILFTILFGTIVLIIIGTILIVFLLQYQKRKFYHKLEVKNLKENFKNTLLIAQLEIQEQTLNKISQEIHDNIGQVLSLAKIYLATAIGADQSQKDAKIIDSKDLISKAISDLRGLSHNLNTDYIGEIGFMRAIEYEMELIKKLGVYETGFFVTGSQVRFNKQKELILFRIVQESLNNIIKHASAKLITLSITFDLGQLSLILTDNGKGFDKSILEKSPENMGMGLKNIHERAKLIDAAVSLKSSPGNGTSIEIKMKN